MNRKTTEWLAEVKIIAFPIENGHEVYIPFSNNSKYDVPTKIVCKENKH